MRSSRDVPAECHRQDGGDDQEHAEAEDAISDTTTPLHDAPTEMLKEVVATSSGPEMVMVHPPLGNVTLTPLDPLLDVVVPPQSAASVSDVEVFQVADALVGETGLTG